MGSFRVYLRMPFPNISLLSELFPGFDIDFKLLDYTRRLPRIVDHVGALDVNLSVVVKKEARIDPMKFKLDRMAPFILPNISTSDVKVLKLTVRDIRANDIECTTVVPNGGGVKSTYCYQIAVCKRYDLCCRSI